MFDEISDDDDALKRIFVDTVPYSDDDDDVFIDEDRYNHDSSFEQVSIDRMSGFNVAKDPDQSRFNDGAHNMNGLGIMRWEGPVDRLDRFRARYDTYLKAELGDDYRIYATQSDESVKLLEITAVEANGLYGTAFWKTAISELLASIQPEDVKFRVLDCKTLGQKIWMSDQMGPKGNGRYLVSPRETPVVIEFKGFKFIQVTMRTEFADAGYSKAVVWAVSGNQDLAPLYWLVGKAKEAVRKAERSIRSIRVYGGENIPLPPTSWSSWDDLILSDEVIKKVKDDLDFFLNNEKIFRDAGLAYKRGFLLCGSPGGGKTSICRTVATSMPFSAYMFDFSNQHLGNADLTKAFREAVQNAPSVFFLEDIDRLFDPDKSQKCNVTLDHLLNCLDGIAVNDGLVVIATANDPKKLDPAIKARPGRFDQVVELNPPVREHRIRYINHLFRNNPLGQDSIDFIADNTDGFSMAFLKEIFVVTATKAMGPGGLNITLDIVKAAVEQVLAQYGGISKGSDRRAGFGSR